MKKQLAAAVALAIATTACVIAGMSFAASEATGADAALKIGDAAPAWVDLEGVDGKKHSLVDLEKAKAVLVVFTCNHCPVAKAYEDRLAALAKDFEEQDVEVVAISVSNSESDSLPAMKKRAEEKGFEFAYLHDPTQKIGREYGATVTPHAFLLDGERKVVYVGAIDDNMNPEKAAEHFVRDAIDAVLGGRTPVTTETEPSGCGISYD
jgi:peroxiredoxin